MGWLFDPGKDKAFHSTAKFLGGLETFLPNAVRLQPTPEREESIRSKLHQAIQTKKLPPKEARSLGGRLVHLASFFLGKDWPRTNTSLGKCSQVSEALLASLKFHMALLDLQPYRTISLLREQPRKRIVYRDAACETRPPFAKPHVQVSWLILGSADGIAVGGFAVVPFSVLQSFQERHTYIAQGEAFGPLLAVHFHTDLLRSAHNIFFIDNLGVLSALVSGRARIADLGTVIHAFHLSMAHLDSTVWFEHVESPANCFDGGSRVGASCPVAQELGIALTRREFPPWPSDVLQADPETWLSFLNLRKSQHGQL